MLLTLLRLLGIFGSIAAIGAVFILVFYTQTMPKTYARNPQTQYSDEDDAESSKSQKSSKNQQKSQRITQDIPFVPLPRLFRETFSMSYAIAHTTGTSEQTYSQYYATALKCAKAFLELKDSSSYQACGIFLANQKEYAEFYMGCLMNGFVPVGIYETLEKMGVQHILKLSKMQWIVVKNSVQLDAVLEANEELGAESALQVAIVLEDGFGSEKRGNVEVYSLEEFLQQGEYITESDVVACTDKIKPNDLATLIFTSGTTGLSKAVRLSHGNLSYATEVLANSTIRQLRLGNPALSYHEKLQEIRFLSYLPLAHIAEQLITILVPSVEPVNVHFAHNRKNLLSELQQARPNAFMGVPRVWEKFHAGLAPRLTQMGFFKRTLIRWAMNTCYQANQILMCHGVPLTPFMAFKYRAARYLAIDKIKAAIGVDKCFMYVSGAGPLSPELAQFFCSIDVTIMECYGQSEGVGVVTFNQLGAMKFGTVGKPLRGMQLKIDPVDNEILIKGPAVFSGYLNDEQATKEVFTADGFMRTGDVGEIDEDGFLRITGRKKDIIITSGGKNISPALIENLWKATSAVVGDVAVVGDNKPFLTAVVSLDEDHALKLLREQGKGDVDRKDLYKMPEIQELVTKGMQEMNTKLSQVEKIKRFVIAPEAFSTKNGMLTDTLKVKRTSVAKQYSNLIDGMYSSR